MSSCKITSFDEINKNSRYINQVADLLESSFPTSMSDFHSVVPFLLSSGNRGFVAVENDKVIGFLMIEERQEEIRVRYVAVKNQCRMIGIGRMLVGEAEKIAIEKNKIKITIETEMKNIPFYKKLGFDVDSTRGASVRMSKRLDSQIQRLGKTV